jgi:hypothetical protein
MTQVIKTRKGGRILIDPSDFGLVGGYTWTVKRSGRHQYAVTWISGHLVRMHRLIMAPDRKFVIDHINGNGLDNRRKNLRICLNAENCRNQRLRVGVKFKGVNYVARVKRFRAYVTLNRKQTHLGYFERAIDAAKAYNKKARELHGEYARLNKIR